jgi:sugar phosphate isomerase/epimerase
MQSCITVSLVDEARGGPFVFWDDLAAACAKSQALGFDAIEIFAPSADAVDRNQLTQLLKDHELKLAAVGTGAGWVKHRLQLASADAGERSRASDFIKTIIDFGGPFGAAAIIGSMQGSSGPDVDGPTARGYLSEALETLGEYASQYDTPLIYEPLNRYETNQVNTMADGVKLLSALSTDNVKLLCDLFHMNIEEVDIADAIRKSGSHVGHVHFVDTNRRPVGTGHMEIAPIIAALKEINYQGYLSAEALPHPNPDAAAEQTIKAYRAALA